MEEAKHRFGVAHSAAMLFSIGSLFGCVAFYVSGDWWGAAYAVFMACVLWIVADLIEACERPPLDDRNWAGE